MATLEERLEDEEYKLWVKAGVCIDAVKSGLEGFVRSRSERAHMLVKTALRNNNSVNNLCLYAHIEFDRRLKKWSLGCCPDCQVYIDKLENLKVPPFTFKQSNWNNTDIKKWPNEPWEMMKVFMNPGQTAAQKDPRESDLSAILNFITHCTIPCVDINDQNNIAKVLDARNQIMRSAQMKMSLSDFQKHTKAMIDLLEDELFLYYLQDAKDAVKIIKEVQAASFCITRSDEVKTLNNRTAAILEQSSRVTAEIAELRSEQENIRLFVNSDIKQSEALVKNKTDDRQEALDNLTKEMVIKEKALKNDHSSIDCLKNTKSDNGPQDCLVHSLQQPSTPVSETAHELPAEILRMDNKSVDLFKKALEDGKERDYNIRIMVVGPFSVGKTTFTNRLLCQDIDMNERNSTDGIDVHVGKCKVSLNTMDWTVEPGDTTDVNALKRLAKILKSTRKSGDDQALEKNTITVSKQEEIRTNEGDRAIIEEETVKQNRSSANADLDSAVCLNDSDTMDSQQYQEDLLMKDLKEIVEAGDTGEDGDNAIVSLWDFGGQFVFYTTHQMFLSRRAIYILVTNLSQHIDDIVTDDVPYFDCSDQRSHRIEEFIDIWLNSIHGHSTKNDKEPPVLLVGTHADKLKPDHREEQIEAMFDAIRNRFAGKDASLHFIDEDFGLSNATEDRKFNDLRKKIIEVAKTQSHWGELKPAKWIPVEKLLEGLRRNGVEILNRTTMKDLNSKLPVPISDDDELDLFLRFQHDIANIMYFSLPELRDKIVLSPQFLVNALKTLITAKEFVKKKPEVLESWVKFSQQGLLKPTLLDAVWKNTRFEENRDHLLALMEHLNIIARPVTYAENKEAGDCNKTQEQEYFLVPCMLKESPPLSFFQYEESFTSTPCLCLELGHIAFPSAIFNRLLCACISQWPIAKKETKYLMYCGCGQFEVDGQHRLALSCSSNIIGLRIVRFCSTGDPDGTVCKEVYSVVKRILQRIGDGLSLKISYKEFVKCPLGRKDSFECRHAVEKVRDSDEFPCHGHTDVGILRRSELLKCWFDSNEFDQVQRSIDCMKNTKDDNGLRDCIAHSLQEPSTPEAIAGTCKRRCCQDSAAPADKHNFKKNWDDTLDQPTVAGLKEAMNSVGALVYYGHQTATVFRVGSKCVVSTAHSVARIFDPLSSGVLNKSEFNDPNVVINFHFSLQHLQESTEHLLPFYHIKRLVYYNVEYDVAVLELRDPNKLPPKLTLCQSNLPAWLVHIIGYGHESNVKTLDPKCKVISPTDPSISAAQKWLQDNKDDLTKWSHQGVQLTSEHWGYHGCGQKEKIIFSCYLEKGSSGAPILAFYNPVEPVVVGMVTNGLPYCFWELTAYGQSRFPLEYRFEMGTRMSAIYADMIRSEPDLANDLYPQ